MNFIQPSAFRRFWWVVLLRGIVAVLFGLVAIFWPGLTAQALILAFGIFAILDGAFAIVTAFQRRSHDDGWWAWLLEGILSVIVGLMALFWPAATALALIIWIAVWAILGGILRVIAAIRLRHEIEGEWALGLSGLLMAVWGGLLIALPGAGVLTLTLLFGIFALMIGAALIALALRIRSLTRQAGTI